MPSYLSLINWTDQGIRSVKDSPTRLDAVKQAARDAGGRVIFFYLTMGQYDIATLVELPSDEVAARFLLTLGSQGNVRSTTLKAFTEQEYRNIIGSLP
ncbi:MAG: GYD domain-containing protein [Chloroflexi bacterium]|nr:GYD domain-containing protein [Chloroflexota bacterium]